MQTYTGVINFARPFLFQIRFIGDTKADGRHLQRIIVNTGAIIGTRKFGKVLFIDGDGDIPHTSMELWLVENGRIHGQLVIICSLLN